MAPLTQFAKRTVTALTATSGTSQDISEVPCTYHGFSFRETGGTTATIVIYNNTAASGTILDTIALTAGESAREWYDRGIAATVGITVDVTGTVQGSVRKARAT